MSAPLVVTAAEYRAWIAGRAPLPSGSETPTPRSLGKPHAQLEADFQEAIVEAGALFGWRAFHPFDSRRSRAGWPDLALWHPWAEAPLHLRELKVPPNTATPAQAETLEHLEHASRHGFTVGLWTPDDWPAIHETLAGNVRRRL
jgi:hypothetical protein